MYARFLLCRRNHATEGSVGDYPTALRKLAEDCGFGNEQLPLDVMTRDRLVFRINNEAFQQRPLVKLDLTFKVSCNMTLTADATAKQWRNIRTSDRGETKDGQGLIQASRTKQGTTAEESRHHRCNGKHAPHLYSFKKVACFKSKKLGCIARASC